jgi:hypothetical protein
MLVLLARARSPRAIPLRCPSVRASLSSMSGQALSHGDVPKCVRCSGVITDTDRVIMMHGDLFHRTCWQILSSELRRADSRQLAKLSAELVKRSRERLRRIPPPPSE